MALCLIGAGETVRLAVAAFTLSWMHTVEKIPWQERWTVADHKLVLTEARIKGSGAGMDPPPGARLIDGWYVWVPKDGEREEIVLRQSGIGRWTFCAAGIPCAPLSDVFGRLADPLTLRACG